MIDLDKKFVNSRVLVRHRLEVIHFRAVTVVLLSCAFDLSTAPHSWLKVTSCIVCLSLFIERLTVLNYYSTVY